MKLFITGSTGKIGTRVTRYLAERGHDLKVLVRETSQAHNAQQQGWDVVQGDLANTKLLNTALTGMDAVVHLAAFFRGASPDQIKEVNEIGTAQLAKAAIEANVARFIYTSTSLVYGAGDGHAALERDLGQPRFPYPQSKLAAEKNLVALMANGALDPRILRLAFVYGDGDSHLTDWLPKLRELPGNRRFQLIHHADVCQAIALALISEKSKGCIYNVADDESLEVADILKLLTDDLGKSSEVLSEQAKWEGIMDSRKIRNDLGFLPTFPSLRDAIAKRAL
jgi:UDP-glucose 4-epimerase